MDIKLLNYSEGPMKADLALWDSVADRTAIDTSVECRLRHTPGKDVIGMQFDFTLSYGGEQLIKTGFLFGMRIAGLGRHLDESLPEETQLSTITEIIRYIWPYVVGAMAARCAEKSIELILPPVDYAALAGEVTLTARKRSEPTQE